MVADGTHLGLSARPAFGDDGGAVHTRLLEDGGVSAEARGQKRLLCLSEELGESGGVHVVTQAQRDKRTMRRHARRHLVVPAGVLLPSS